MNTTRDYRFIPFAALVVVAGVLVLLQTVGPGYEVFYRSLGIHPLPFFSDLQALFCGVDEARAGGDAYATDCSHIPQGYFNYPRIWTVLKVFPFLSVANSFWIGWTLAVVFLFSIYQLIGKLNKHQAVYYTFLLLSPAVLLGMERGNTDLMMFALLAFALARPFLQYLLRVVVLIAAMFKLFPIGGVFALLLGEKGKFRTLLVWTLVVGVLFCAYVFVVRDNLKVVSAITPRPYKGACFGLGVLPTLFLKSFPQLTKVFLIAFPTMALAVLGTIYWFKRSAISISEIAHDAKGTAFLAGSGIFLITNLIGYNWEYRLVFLLFTVPQMLAWLQQGHTWTRVPLALIALIMWQSAIGLPFPIFELIHPYHVISQVFNYLLLCYLLVVLFFFMKKCWNDALQLFLGRTNP